MYETSVGAAATGIEKMDSPGAAAAVSLNFRRPIKITPALRIPSSCASTPREFELAPQPLSL